MSHLNNATPSIITTATIMASVLISSGPTECYFGFTDIADADHSYLRFQDHVDTTFDFSLVAIQKEKFRTLADQWKKETAVKSILETVILNPSYQKIVGMGQDALPFIFEDLKKSRLYWAHALAAITAEDPVPEDANMAQVREIWLAWGIQHGYVSS